jgi:hypothetical protein
MRRTTDEILIRGYLLGNISQEERARFEDQYFANPDMFEELLAAENDLIDCYVQGELNFSERQRFEVQFLDSPQRRPRVEFARALNQVSHQTAQAEKASLWRRARAYQSRRRPTLRWAIAGAALLVVTAGSWLMVQNQRLRAELRQAQAGQLELRRQEDALRQQIGSLEGDSKSHIQENQPSSEVAKLETPFPYVTLRLTSGMARGVGGRQNTLVLPPAGSWVRLVLVLDRDEYGSYQAVIRTAEGSEIDRVEGLSSHRTATERVVVVRLPSKLIRPGDYILTLNGSSKASAGEAEAYSFRVVHG